MIISSYHEEQLRIYLQHRPMAYLNEMAWFLYDEHQIECSEATVWRALTRPGRLNWSRNV